MSAGLARDLRGHPDTPILWDDNFNDGFCGWEELYNQPASAWSSASNAPLSLSPRGKFGRALLLTTNPIRQFTYGSSCAAIKRQTHQLQPNGSLDRIVEFEVWFSYGGRGVLSGSSEVGSPGDIIFAVDSMVNQSTTTAITSPQTGRAFFQLDWAHINTAPVRTGAIKLAHTVGTFGVGGYKAADDLSGEFVTGYVADLASNANKANSHYMRMRVNCSLGTYLAAQFDHYMYDLTACPNGAVGDVLSAGDTSYNDFRFAGGLNGIITLANRTDADIAAWMEVHRTRMSVIQ